MDFFELYLKLGFKHIIDINGYDHIVFVLALCAGYQINQLKKVLILITAFTIGHSITLALATLKIILIPAPIIEFLIPVTILIAAVSNLLPVKEGQRQFVYIITLFFGFIHGLGFSNYLKELLGNETSIVKPLLSFNIGLEIGQILVLSIYFLILSFAVHFIKIKHEIWKIFISGAAFGISLMLIIQNRFWLS